MSCLLDSSVLVAALLEEAPAHARCGALLERDGVHAYVHSLTEVFATLTGGRLGCRVPQALATELIEFGLLPFVSLVSLTTSEIVTAMRLSESRGIRGGAIYDYLHVVAARKVKAGKLYTLDVSDFLAFHRPGDPEVAMP
jgi:predicted nucleic acid-binding protein